MAVVLRDVASWGAKVCCVMSRWSGLEHVKEG